jgi:CRISPR-associated protein Cas5h
MNTVCFDYKAKYGHFLRAEANANGVTYPVPPRTALLGLIAAVLGLPKDALARDLADSHVAVGGTLPQRFWTKTNVRKDPPAPLPRQVKKTDKGTVSEQRNFRFPQEWLWQPCYRVWASLPGTFQADFAARLRDRRWHFTPCMGLSEMLADLEFVSEDVAAQLPDGTHLVATAVARRLDEKGQFRQDVDAARAAAGGLTLQSLRMPAAVTEDRVFQHRSYWLELQGRPFPIRTDEAWQAGPAKVSFL